MNKLQGFYELRYIGIPSVPWKVFDRKTELDPNLLWTIRMAREHGDDISLPREIGVTADFARKRALEFQTYFGDMGFVIFYPYFIALKSGIADVKENQTIIEAVYDDLWNLTTGGDREVTLFIDRRTRKIRCEGNSSMLSPKEVQELLMHCARVRRKFKHYIFDQRSVMVEWSYAVNSDINKKPVGDPYLVFYECRVVG